MVYLDPRIRYADMGIPICHIHEWLVDCHTDCALPIELGISLPIDYIILFPGGESNYALLE